MTRTQRRLHRFVWMILMPGAGIGLAILFALRPPDLPPEAPTLLDQAVAP